MTPHAKPFLTAHWRSLAMLNFEIDPRVLRPLVPAGTELDAWHGRTFVSVVGFLFLDTRVCGIALPFHRNFEEVNLRFYVRRVVNGEVRRAVVFVKEIVPRAAIAWTARALYGENYVALAMQHRIELDPAAHARRVMYSWQLHGANNVIELTCAGVPHDIAPESEVEFIAEHYWGYARRRDGRTHEYRVAHPRWQVSDAATSRLECDVAALYGSQFVESLSARPASAFLAVGSEVSVFKGTTLRS